MPAMFRMNKCRERTAEIVPYNLPHFPHPCGSDAGGTSPWTGEGRTMQEQLSRATHGAVADDCTDAGGRATHGAVAERRNDGGLFFVMPAEAGIHASVPPHNGFLPEGECACTREATLGWRRNDGC